MVPTGWSGTVTPSLGAHVFTPGSRNYVNVTAHQPVQDYTSNLFYQITGTIAASGSPLSGVALAATNGATCSSSNASGQYSCTVPHNWSGVVTPSSSGYLFVPASRSHDFVTTHKPGQDYAATLQSAAGPIYYVHVDHLNTPRLVADATGTTVWKWDQQEPFGNNVADENPSGLGAFDLPLRMPGQYLNKETNLYYNYFRNYDAASGRYAESDPVGLRGGLNTYAYSYLNPISWSDLFGLTPAKKSGSQKCQSLAKKIENIENDIQKRITDISINPQSLPLLPPYPGAPNRASVTGHQRIIDDLKGVLERRRKEYKEECCDDCDNNGGGGSQATTSNMSTAAKVGIGITGAACVAICVLQPEICVPLLLIGGATGGAAMK